MCMVFNVVDDLSCDGCRDFMWWVWSCHVMILELSGNGCGVSSYGCAVVM